MAFLASLLPSILPSLLGSGGAGSLIKTVADIGKELIVPVGTKLLQAAGGILGGGSSGSKESFGTQAMNILKEGGKELVQRGMRRLARPPPQEVMEVEEEEEVYVPPPPKKRRRAPKGSSAAYYKMKEPLPTKKQKYEEYEGVGDMFNEHRDYEA